MPSVPDSKRDVFEYTSPPVGYRLKPVPHIDHPPQGGHVETVTYLSTRRMATLPGPRGRAVRATMTLKSCWIDGACSPHPASVEHCPGDRRYQLFVGLLGLPLHGPGRRRTRKSADIREFGHSQPPECPQCLVLFEYVYHPTGDRLKLVPHTDRPPQVATYKPLQMVPMRPLDAAARTRMHCTRHQSRKFVPGRRCVPPLTCQQRALPGRPTPPRCCRCPGARGTWSRHTQRPWVHMSERAGMSSARARRKGRAVQVEQYANACAEGAGSHLHGNAQQPLTHCRSSAASMATHL